MQNSSFSIKALHYTYRLPKSPLRSLQSLSVPLPYLTAIHIPRIAISEPTMTDTIVAISAGFVRPSLPPELPELGDPNAFALGEDVEDDVGLVPPVCVAPPVGELPCVALGIVAIVVNVGKYASAPGSVYPAVAQ
jgi:hypothetical protein